MRILMLNNEFPPLGGGTGTVNQAILRYFGQIECLEVDLVTSALGKRAEQEVFAERVRIYKVPVNNSNIHHSSNRELTTYAIRGFLLAFKLNRKRSYDLCFAWSAVPAGAIALLLRRLTGLRFIVRVCGPDIPGFEPRYNLIHRVISPLIHAVWRGAEVVVVKSHGELEMIQKLNDQVSCSLVPNGVDLSMFDGDGRAPDHGPLRLVCVARLIERKGQHHLVEAVKRLSEEGIDIRLELVGSGDSQTNITAQVEQLGLQDRVKLLGYIPRDEIVERYKAAHVFVLPSYNEGMSVATLEAMASGLPVLVTRTAGMKELVQEGVNGLTFAWGDITLLTSHLKRIYHDRSMIKAMGISSRMLVQTFSWETTASRLLETIECLASPSTSRADGTRNCTNERLKAIDRVQ